MKKNVKKHTNGVWYYAVVRWDGYGVFPMKRRLDWFWIELLKNRPQNTQIP